MNRLLTVLVFLLLPAASALGQDFYPWPYERAQIGLVGGIDFSWQSGTFTTGDAQFDCCTF